MDIFQVVLRHLREGADGSCNPGNSEHDLCPPGVGHVGDGEHDGGETVKGDDNHEKAGEIETNNPKEDHDPACKLSSHPRNSCTPGYL